MAPGRGTRRPPALSIDLSSAELRSLVALSVYYQRSMGPMRHLVRLTGSRETRTRFRFLDEEGAVLRDFAETMLGEANERPLDIMPVPFTPAALVAFWGRILSSLNSPRSRRRLSPAEVERRQLLAAKFEVGVRSLLARDPATVEVQIGTRRPAEQTWMRARLGADDPPASLK